jgi:uncharacterized membrane protein YgcG
VNGKRPSPRTIRIASAGTAAAALLAAFAAVAGAGLQSTSSSASEYEYGPGSHQYGQKVTLCHHTHSKKHPWVTITVGSAAVAAHLKHHGDTLGACPAVVPVVNGNKHHGHKGGDNSSDQNTQGNSSSSGNGNSGSHGKSGDHGNSGGHGNNGHGK